ncbi:MAG: hypothetical protein J6Y02_13230 [Pseudobutyrivibrio sp.]|nr:hypothetical protein [Pseudobutyrivibrio sp.]
MNNYNEQPLLLTGGLTADELPEGRAIYDTNDKNQLPNPEKGLMESIPTLFDPGGLATGATNSYLIKRGLKTPAEAVLEQSIATGLGGIPIIGALAKKNPVVRNTIKQIPFSDQTVIGTIKNRLFNKPRFVEETINGVPYNRPENIQVPKGQGTNHSKIGRVEEGKTFKEGDTYRAYDRNSWGFKDKKMSKELADNLNDRVELQKEEGKIPIYSDTGTIYGIPNDVKYADDLINDANLLEIQQNAHNANIMDLEYGYDPSIAENVLLGTLNNKAAIDAYRRPYGDPLQLTDVYNHYSYEPIKSVKRGIVGSRAGDNLNMGGTGAIYLTDDTTTLGGFPYKNEFIGPSKDLFIQPYEMGVNDLNSVTSARLKELESGYNRLYDPEDISNFFLEKPYNKENPKIGVLQRGAIDANIDNAFNRILRQGGYAGFQDTHGIWEGRTLEPFQEYGLLRPEDLFHTGSFKLMDKIPKVLRR